MIKEMLKKNKSFNVCLLGCWLDSNNKGIAALATSLIKLILDIRPDSYISLLIGSKSSNPQEVWLYGKKVSINVVNYRLSLRARINEHLLFILLLALLYKLIPFRFVREYLTQSNNWLKTIKQSDFIGDIWGGDSFSDIYGFFRFIIGIIPRIIIILLNEKLVLLPQTYGPYNSRFATMIARSIMHHSNYILSRDKESITLTKEILGKKQKMQNIRFCPDVAFVLDPQEPETLEITPKLNISPSEKLIGLNINGLLFKGGYTGKNMFNLKFDYKDFIYNLIYHLMNLNKVHILLLPHTFGLPGNLNSDPDACNELFYSVKEKYKNRIHLLVKEYNPNEIKWLIGLCDFFIGSRMHSCIAALSQGIITIGVGYSKKFIGVFTSINLGNLVIDARSISSESALNFIRDTYMYNKLEENYIKDQIDIAKTSITDIFSEILKN